MHVLHAGTCYTLSLWPWNVHHVPFADCCLDWLHWSGLHHWTKPPQTVTGSAVARYCPLWAWLHSHQPARFCFWELTKQLPRVVTHPGIAPASNSLNFGVPTNPKPVSSQKASRYEDARCAI
ncbi:hypothetical protein L3X38_004388 [Prunus dulcis]|uniref:Uncharacterized protein n=1 Tax=Prunus dulcis TaxID=3755 RepID=A0AAD5F339_PRUDU|nr:hypothetical protein L3X38_004388 [Prunus dulcis]